MAKLNLMNFDARVREVFENNSEKLFAFNKLMLDVCSIPQYI